MLASWKKSEKVAVKIMEKRARRAARILLESRILKTAWKCPFLCHGIAAFQSQAHVFLVMEHVHGGSLESFMKARGYLKIREARHYSAEIICAMQFLHRRGIIHRDLKPDNILLDRAGHIKVADFGLAVEGIRGSAKTVGVAGTYTHMAPEVILSEEYGTSADWWSFGIILYQMLVGNLPFNINQSKGDYWDCVCSDNPPYPSRMLKWSKDILGKLLEKAPGSRLRKLGNIRLHPFYRLVIWDQLEARNIPPPYQPPVEPTRDLQAAPQEMSLSNLVALKHSIASEDRSSLAAVAGLLDWYEEHLQIPSSFSNIIFSNQSFQPTPCVVP
ncbi:protein kinase C delta type-like [Pelodytes ibericus]